MSVSKRSRFEVLKRDNHTCRYCGGIAPDVVLTVDHVTPVALGGTDDPNNLVAACRDCNAGKSSTNPSAATLAAVNDDALRWAAAMKAAAERAAAAIDERVSYADAIHDKWAEWDGDACRNIDSNWSSTVERWRIAGLPVDVVMDAVEVAWRATHVQWRDKYRYMCGIVWSRLTKMQDDAKALLAEQDPQTPPPPVDLLADFIDGRLVVA